jgi:hypothetical protein
MKDGGGPQERQRPEEMEASTKGGRGSGGGTTGERKEGVRGSRGAGRRLGFVECGWTMLQFP